MLVFANSRRLTGRNGNCSKLAATRFMPAGPEPREFDLNRPSKKAIQA